MWSLDQHSHEGLGLMFRVRLGACVGAGMNPGLQVAVQVLVGIQFRRVRRKIEDGYLLLVLLEPLGYLLAVVDLEIVEDQVDLPSGIPDKSAHEGDEFHLGHRFAVDHEPYLPPLYVIPMLPYPLVRGYTYPRMHQGVTGRHPLETYDLAIEHGPSRPIPYTLEQLPGRLEPASRKEEH